MVQQLSGPELAPQSGSVKRLVIFLHGVGADGNDLIGLAPMVKDALPDTQFLSPNAPFRFDMAPFGYQWFSLIDRSPQQLLLGAQTAAPLLNAYIDAQRDRFKLKDSDIALIGFSQGTMMSLFAGLRREKPLAGIVGFSGAMIGAELLAAEAISKPPVCLIHGAMDEVVPHGALAHAVKALKAGGISVEDHTRPHLGHGIDPEGIEIGAQFLRKRFGI